MKDLHCRQVSFKSLWHDPSRILKEIVGIIQESVKGLCLDLPYVNFRLSFRNCKSCIPYNCNDLLSYNSSLCSSQIWFQYIHNFIIILSQVYNKPIQRPALSWLVSLIGRVLHQHRRGQGFKSLTSLNFFQVFFLQLQKLCL